MFFGKKFSFLVTGFEAFPDANRKAKLNMNAFCVQFAGEIGESSALAKL